MTEDEWLEKDDAVEMIVHLRFVNDHPRKSALFSIATCRLISNQLDERSRELIAMAEENEDRDWTRENDSAGFERRLRREEVLITLLRSLQFRGPLPQAASYVRDIFGNPFRAMRFDPSWRTSTATAIARQMYESRDFSTMPILADALQDAGCENEGVLTHCRGPGPHVRGCWVVDCVLDKK